MKKTIIVLFFVLGFKITFSQTCNASFSYSASFEKVNFFNYSNIQNAHYYWDFGDGTSSYFKNPFHSFPGNGHFIVTLYIHDTINNCSNYFESQITVTKQSSSSCNPMIKDSLYIIPSNPPVSEMAFIEENSSCASSTKQFFFCGGAGSGNNNTFYLGNGNVPQGNYIGHVRYSSPLENVIAIQTVPINFNKSKNYSPCSANFEFSVLKQDSFSQVIHFKAMNKNAQTYTWYFTGFGDPIVKTTDTANIFYDASYNLIKNTNPFFRTTQEINLITKDVNGCKDSVKQYIYINSQANTTVDIKKNSEENFELNVYPNPIKDKLSIELNNKEIIKMQLTILNSLGQIVYSMNAQMNKQTLDLSFLPRAIYYLKISTDNYSKAVKLIKD